jgi:hypothetical protein
MKTRVATLTALAAVFTMAFAGTASAELLSAGAGPVSYSSQGTHDDLRATIDDACADVGQQSTPDNPITKVSVCIPRPVDEEAGEQPGDNGYQLASEEGLVFWSSDGFFADAMNPCFLAGIAGSPVESFRVDPADGVWVAVCE